MFVCSFNKQPHNVQLKYYTQNIILHIIYTSLTLADEIKEVRGYNDVDSS